MIEEELKKLFKQPSKKEIIIYTGLKGYTYLNNIFKEEFNKQIKIKK